MPKYKELTCRVFCCCSHCGERFCANSAGQCAMYCTNCKLADQRKDMCADNKENLKDYSCKICGV